MLLWYVLGQWTWKRRGRYRVDQTALTKIKLEIMWYHCDILILTFLLDPVDLGDLLWRRWTIDILQLAYEISQDIAMSTIQYMDTWTNLLVTQLNTFQKVLGFLGRLLSVVSAMRMDTLCACSACKVSIITSLVSRDKHPVTRHLCPPD